MTEATSNHSNRKMRRLVVLAGVFCIVVSVLAVILSLGLPGGGWVVAAVALTIASLLVPVIGRRYAIVTLVVSAIHLLTFGPLSLFGSAAGRGQLPAVFLIVFVIAPLAFALLAILIPGWRDKAGGH